MRYPILLFASVAICFGAQWMALRSSGGRFTKNESNYFSSLGRIQAGTTGRPDIMFLGSSLTGRLPDRASGFSGVANMGCDGGCAIDVLRAMDRGELPAAPRLMVEVNTMTRALDPQESAIGAATTRPWFKLGMRVPLLSAYARPSGFFYSKLLARKIGSFEIKDGSQDLGISSLPTVISMPERDWGDAEQSIIDEVDGIVRRLRANETETIFYWIPPGRGAGDAPMSWLLALPARSEAPWWDVGQEADPSLIELTDGAHMAAPSAARTVRSVMRGLQIDQ